MSKNPTRSTKFLFGSGCLYAAAYLTIAAAGLFFYQAMLWYRTGAWLPHNMWQVLILTGWQHPPSMPWSRAQLVIDRLWDTIGNCPISIALSVVAIVVAVIGMKCSMPEGPVTGLRNAH